MRWRYALPSPQLPQLEATRVSLQGEPIIAPLTGRPCVAYEVGVRTDDDAQAPLGTWLLIEQGVAPLIAGGTSIPEGKAWLELRSRTRHQPGDPGSVASLRRFLRERGFDRPDLVVFETIVEPDASVRARTRAGRVVLEG